MGADLAGLAGSSRLIWWVHGGVGEWVDKKRAALGLGETPELSQPKGCTLNKCKHFVRLGTG